MGNQIIKQPDGKFCVFNTTISEITHENMKPSEVIDLFVSWGREDTTNFVVKVIGCLNNDESPYISTIPYFKAVEMTNKAKND